MSAQSFSISPRSESFHARSCGESTNTPSTSKIAPSKPSVGTIAPLLVQRRHPLFTGGQFPDLVADTDPDWPAEALGEGVHGELVVGDAAPERGAAELHRERQSVEPVGEGRGEVQHPAAHASADVAALQQVKGARHDTHVDALLGGAALHVAHIALERDEEALP